MRRRGILLAAVFLPVVIVGCSPGAQEGLPDSFRAYYQDASQYQQEILADGIVTLGEYEGALYATKSCIEGETDGLVSVTDPFPSPEGIGLELNLNWTTGETDAEEERISTIAREAAFSCSAEYSDFVEMAYLETHALSESEIEADTAAFLVCVRESGFEQFDETTMRLDVDRFWSQATNEESSALGACADSHPVGYSNLPTEDD